jgi:hypothetical protein
MTVVVTGARVELADGTVVALIERIRIGGGIRTRTIDGEQVDEQQPSFERHHARLLSQAGPMIPDELVETETFEQACEAGEAYAKSVTANAAQIAALRASLKRG